MIFSYKPMTLDNAKQIITWKYNDEYSIYSFSDNDEDLAELMNGEYFSSFDAEGKLIGYICHGQSARVPGGVTKGIYEEAGYNDIGLGLKPDLTGKNIGLVFLNQGIEFLKGMLQTYKFRLVVAEFNKRAITVYERAGFKKDVEFYSKVSEDDILFISMKLENV